MKRPLAVAGAVVFVCLYFFWDYPWLAIVLCALGEIAALIAALLYRKVKLKKLLAISVLVLISCLMFSGARYFVYRPAAELVGQTVHLTAHTQDYPEQSYGRYTYTFTMDEVNGEPFHTKVMLYSYESLALEPFDAVEMTALLEPVTTNADSVDYYSADKIFLRAGEFTLLSVTPDQDIKPLSYSILMLRESLSEQVLSNLSAENGGLLNGLLLGDQSGVSADITHDFRYTGISHLLSVSGLHMSVWAVAVFGLLKRTRLGQRAASAIAIGFVLLFMALTGFTPSVVRSGVMMVLYLGASLFRRTPDSLNSLGGAVFVYLIANPFAARDIGLILSALATFGIIVLNPMVARILKSIDAISFAPARRVIRWIIETVFISVNASVFTLPVVLASFGMIPILTPLSNMFISILGAPVMITGGIAAAFGVCGITLILQPLFAVSGFITQLMIRLSNAFADIPYVSYYFQLDSAVSALIAGIIAAVVLWIVLRDSRALPIGILAAALVCVLAVNIGYQYVLERDQAVLHVVNGSNPCVLVESNGRKILIGSGSNGSGFDLLEQQNVYRVDFLYLWSDDPDSEKSAVIQRCCGISPVIQGEAFRAAFGDEMTLESDGKKLLLHVNGRTVCIAENLKEEQADVLIAGRLADNIDYSHRPAVETNTRYARGENALTVPYNGDIIIKVDQNAQIWLDGG